MTIKQIEKLVKRKNQLTPKEKSKLVKGILTNKQAKKTAMIGAMLQKDYNLMVLIHCS